VLAAALVVCLTAVVVIVLVGPHGLVGFAVALVAVGAVLLVSRRKLGGSTGDVLGACVEIAFAAYLVTQVGELPAL
jgi:adenosylcobinamide-GDP ribazoletransferase